MLIPCCPKKFDLPIDGGLENGPVLLSPQSTYCNHRAAIFRSEGRQKITADSSDVGIRMVGGVLKLKTSTLKDSNYCDSKCKNGTEHGHVISHAKRHWHV
eukprot:gnl/TRDRNA2_/TRDRNA2_160077_c1_seq1.p2 gnl/TRDRNA2_/TRDRNA2_160077_c1~~gnl/TRDRNA2_/TRDRNA2_160077_c1_seq1.p2  ORF type:complete len:100 (+),score=15.01 gnl/TRDRNA2_/TRDRNA2_160077_c1_seq1:189-488(+)